MSETIGIGAINVVPSERTTRFVSANAELAKAAAEVLPSLRTVFPRCEWNRTENEVAAPFETRLL